MALTEAVVLMYHWHPDNKSLDEHANEVLPTYFHEVSVDTALQMVKSEYDSNVEEEDNDEDDVEEEDVVEEKKGPAAK